MSYVYVIQGSHGTVKIGHSVSPPQRLADLQTGSPYRLQLAYTLYVGAQASAVEDEAHDILQRHRGIGEWFSVAPDVAVAAIGAAAFRLKAFAEARELVEPWKTRFCVLAALLTPAWLMPTPLPFCGVLFVFVAYAAYASSRYRETRLPQIARWLGLVGAAAIASIVAATTISAAAKAAETIPVYDSKKYCGNLSAFLGDNSLIRDGCLSSEAEAKEKLKHLWPVTPEAIQSDCIKTVAAGSSGSFQALGGCLALMVGHQWYEGKLHLTP